MWKGPVGRWQGPVREMASRTTHILRRPIRMQALPAICQSRRPVWSRSPMCRVVPSFLDGPQHAAAGTPGQTILVWQGLAGVTLSHTRKAGWIGKGTACCRRTGRRDLHTDRGRAMAHLGGGKVRAWLHGAVSWHREGGPSWSVSWPAGLVIGAACWLVPCGAVPPSPMLP